MSIDLYNAAMNDVKDPKRWAIVLSGGEGERMRPFVERWMGSHRPKQYCAFTGQRTMLEHTYDRALDLVAPERIVTVIGQNHARYLQNPRKLDVPGPVLEQPAKKDTSPGIFLPLTYVLSRDPEAIVAILPSDHFIHPRDRFQKILNEAYSLAEHLPGQLVLLSCRPDQPEPEYGWIKPGTRLKRENVFLVDRFVEKPGPTQALELFRHGGLWSSFILVARVATIWDLAWGLMPSMMSRFAALQSSIGTSRQAEAVAMAYQGMETSNFSRDFLERLADWTVTLPMSDIAWCDWGQPKQVLETLYRLGRTPVFPKELVHPVRDVPVSFAMPLFPPVSLERAAAR